MGLFEDGWDEVKKGAGDVLDDGAKVIGDGLNAAGLHGAARTVETEGAKLGYRLGADAGELELGQTNDPGELIHGDAGAIRSAASKLKSFSTAFGETGDGLRRIVGTGHWEGAAADAFRARFAPEPAKWSAACEAMGKASGALESYAAAVRSAQAKARQAIDLWEQGQAATKQASAAYDQQMAAYHAAVEAARGGGTQPSQPGSFSDPGVELRAEAQRILAAARQARDGAAASAARAVTAATDLAPAEPSLLAQLGDDISDTLSAGGLAVESFSGGVLEGVAGIVRFARTVSPADPWNITHPTEYLAGLSQTAAGLVEGVLNPAELAKGVVGSGWGADPFQAFGKLMPNVALTALSSGGGAAAGAADAGDAAFSVAEDVTSQGVSDMARVGDPVNVTTGDVVFEQADVALPGALPLVVQRVHRSSWRGGRWLGETWASTFDQRLLIAGDKIAVVFADGRVLFWRRDDVGADEPGALPGAGPAWPLRREGDGAYTVTDPGQGLTWRYESRPGFWRYDDGQGELPLVSVTDRAGHEITYGYAEDGRPASVTDPGGRRIAVTADGGRVRELALDLAGEPVPLVRYSYDDAGNLAGVENSSGRPLRFSYDDAGRMTGWLDRGGNAYWYSYDSRGRCVRGESSSGELSGTFAYEPGVARHTDAAGAVTEYRLDPSFRVTAVTDPLGNATLTSYDQRGRVTSRTDPLGRATRYAYDDAGNPESVTRPDGTVARAEYDQRGLPVTVTDPDGARWRQTYDQRGNRVSLTGPDGAVTRYAYDDAGHLAEVTAPDGAVTTLACDAAGLLIAERDPAGRVRRYERDQFGRTGRIIGPDGSVTAMTWTVEGRPASRTFPDGSAETWTWDADGNLGRHVSAAGAVTSYSYGAFGKVAAASWPDGTRTDFAYDPELRLESVTQGGRDWRYAYDPAGRLESETDYNGAVARYSYDAAGQLVKRVNAAGQETVFGYDPLGRVVSQVAGESVTTFGYDPAGRLVRARNADAEIVLERDALGRVTAETCDGRTVSTSYDAAGRVTGRTTPSGAVTAWDYDAAGLPTAMRAGGRELRFGYGPDGRETVRELPGGVTLSQDWDPLGRLTAQVLAAPGAASGGGAGPSGRAASGGGPGGAPGPEGVLQRRGYAYSPDGFVTGTEDLLAGDRAFGLDAAGRVTGVTGPGWTERYAYDPLGNLASATWPATVPGAGPAGAGAPHEIAGTLLTRAGYVRYRHDAAGRVIQRTRRRISRKPETWRYEWDAAGRLTSATASDGSVWRYRYDPLGRRIAKQHLDPSGAVLAATRFAWDGPVLAEQAEVVAGSDSVAGAGAGAGERVTTWDYHPGSFTPLAQTSRSLSRSLDDASQEEIDRRFYAIVTDLAGTPSELVAADGTLAGHQRHTLWGITGWDP
ncbi:MAG: hypothetical protein J2P26_04620, partial [Nocardiopsaceae bacterium]|nr:hypothetical protein [Nocardiopsaceae bacterium]